MGLGRQNLDSEVFRSEDVFLAGFDGLVGFQHGDAAFVGFDDIAVEVLVLFHGRGFDEVLDVRRVRWAVEGSGEAPGGEAFGFAGVGLADKGVGGGFGFVPVAGLLPELVFDGVGRLDDEGGFAFGPFGPVGAGFGVSVIEAGAFGDDDAAFDAHVFFVEALGAGGGEHLVVGAGGAACEFVLIEAHDVVREFELGLAVGAVVVVDAAGGEEGDGGGFEGPVEHVDLVSAEIGDGAAAVFGIPAPVHEFFHAGEAVLGEKVLRDGLVFGDAEGLGGGDTAVPLAVAVGDAAHHVGFFDDVVAEVEVAGVGVALVADLEDAAGLLPGFDHVLGTFDGVGHHFLAVDGFAGFEGDAGEGGVEEVGGGDEDGLDVLLFFEHFLDGGVLGDGTIDLMLVFVLHPARGGAAVELPDVSDGDPLHAGDVFGSDADGVALSTAADEGALEFAIRVGGLGDSGFAGGEDEAGGGTGVDAGADERAAIHEAGQATGGGGVSDGGCRSHKQKNGFEFRYRIRPGAGTRTREAV